MGSALMNCVCLDMDFDDIAKVCNLTIRKARKPHICLECREAIGVGEQYADERALCDGRWHTYKTCMPCKHVRDDCMKCGWIWGDLWTELHDANCDAEQCICPPNSLARKHWEQYEREEQDDEKAGAEGGEG